MLNHKALIVSLDAMISIPIVFASFLLLFGSFHGYVVQLNSLAQMQSGELKLYSKSQLLVQMLNSLNLNYTTFLSASSNFSSFNQINLTITKITNTTSALCSRKYVCRIVDIENNSYLMVLKNENAG